MTKYKRYRILYEALKKHCLSLVEENRKLRQELSETKVELYKSKN